MTSTRRTKWWSLIRYARRGPRRTTTTGPASRAATRKLSSPARSTGTKWPSSGQAPGKIGASALAGDVDVADEEFALESMVMAFSRCNMAFSIGSACPWNENLVEIFGDGRPSGGHCSVPASQSRFKYEVQRPVRWPTSSITVLEKSSAIRPRTRSLENRVHSPNVSVRNYIH